MEKMSDLTRRAGLRASVVAFAALAFVAACDKGADPSSTAQAPQAPETSQAADPAWPAAAIADPTSAGFTAEGLAALDARMAQSVTDQDVAGIVTLLVRHGEVVQFKEHGVQSGDPITGTPMTKDSVFRIYSMTKPLTGVAMMQLYEQGKWQLDDPVSKYIPEFDHMKRLSWKDGKVEMGSDGKPVVVDASRSPTMRELMTHTAGLAYGLCCMSPKAPNYIPSNKAFVDINVLGSVNLDEMMTKIESLPLIYDPGTRWSYSAAVDVQGYLVEKLSGQKFGDYLKEHVFTPLGMSDTSFYVHPEQASRFTDVYHWEDGKLVVNPEAPNRALFTDPARLESGGGGLVSTTHDYARFCQMMLNKGELAGNRLIKPETVDLMTQNHIGELRMNSDGTAANPGRQGVGFGLDFAVYEDSATSGEPYGKGSYYWTGFAGTWFWIDPVNDLFFVGMIQRQGAARPQGVNFRNESAQMVYDAMSGPAGAAPEAVH
jgi:CubicO group peptidase (beta-lactamase class C family)